MKNRAARAVSADAVRRRPAPCHAHGHADDDVHAEAGVYFCARSGAPVLSQQGRRASQIKAASSKGKQSRPAWQAVVVQLQDGEVHASLREGNAGASGGEQFTWAELEAQALGVGQFVVREVLPRVVHDGRGGSTAAVRERSRAAHLGRVAFSCKHDGSRWARATFMVAPKDGRRRRRLGQRCLWRRSATKRPMGTAFAALINMTALDESKGMQGPRTALPQHAHETVS